MRCAGPLAAVAVGLSACATWSEPPPLLRPAAPAELEAAAPSAGQSSVECFALVSQGLTAIRRSREGATTDWRVQLQNRCAQPAPALVEFWVLDRNNVAIGYEARRVTASANAMVEAVGQIALARPQSDGIASTIARYGIDAAQTASAGPLTLTAAPVAATAATRAAAATPAAGPTASFAAPAQPAAAAARPLPADPLPPDAAAWPAAGAGSDLPVVMTVGAMSWQGNAAMVPIAFVNGTGAPIPQRDVTCEFVALDQVAGTDLQRVPALPAGGRVTITVLADVGGQPVDHVRCHSG
jgi:hypothetical protein